jgi:predicted DsbA family dithiol-disulfide isomerase
MIGLIAAGDVPLARVLREVQHEFFVRGRPLGSPGVIHDVALRLGLDGPALEVFAASERGHEMAAEDFDIAAEFALDESPLLMASHAGRFFEFDGLGATAQRLVDQFNSVLARP